MAARTVIAVSIGAFVLSGCGDGSSTTGSTDLSPPTASTLLGTVATITDGDTIRVDIGEAETQRVRLLGIDSPETKNPNEPPQCFGSQATSIAKELLPLGTHVRLTTDPSQDRIDRYGRLLAYVYRSDEKVSVNEMLISRGAATVYVYRKRVFAQLPAFQSAEATARTAKRGLWESCRAS